MTVSETELEMHHEHLEMNLENLENHENIENLANIANLANLENLVNPQRQHESGSQEPDPEGGAGVQMVPMDE